MTGYLNHYLAQQLIDDRLRVARERQASHRATENHKRHRVHGLAPLLQLRRQNHLTQRRSR